MNRFIGVFLILGLMAPSARADLLWGVNGHPLVSYPGTTYVQQLDLLQDLGMTSYRIDVHSTADTALTELATLISEGQKRGVAILPVLIPPVNLSTQTTSQLYSTSYAFAKAYVTRFKNDIHIWELGNELENHAIILPCEMRDDGTQYPCNWGPAGGVGPLDYYGPRWVKVSAVLKGLSDGVIAVDPGAKKAMGTAGWGHTGAFARMKTDGVRWDISVWHIYGEDPEWAFKELSGYGKPIWVTEFNNASGSYYGESQQASGIKSMMDRLRALSATYNVTGAHVYELMDESYWTDAEGYMGLVHLVKNSSGSWTMGTKKPAYDVVKSAVSGTTPAPLRAPTNLRIVSP